MDLWDQIRTAVQQSNFGVSHHAKQRLHQRGVVLWQVEAGVATAKILELRPQDLPNPSVVCEQTLLDGTPFVAIWAWKPNKGLALLVTVFFRD